jgi:hypothetical protein
MRGDESLRDGLDTLDRDRASSLADEGGRAGAVVEGEVSMKRRTPKPRRDPDPRNPPSPARREDPRNPPAPLVGGGEDVDDTTPTPARPLPAIAPADDDIDDRRSAR